MTTTTKITGLGAALWWNGYDLSNDTRSLEKISGGVATMFDTTGIDKSAHERLPGARTAEWAFTEFFNKLGAHVPLSALTRNDQTLTFAVPTAIGSASACVVGRQIGYDPTRSTAGELTETVDVLSDGSGMEWGNLLTAGKRTDTAATNGAGWDSGLGFATPAVPASTVPVTNTSPLTATVVISAGTLTNVSVNGVTAGTGDGTYTVPPGQTISITYTVAPTWTWALASPFGAQAYLQVFGFAGTDATVKIQDSADGVTYADLASAAFTQLTSSTPQAQRLALTNTATVRRYLRASTVTAGGFTSCVFGVTFCRNPVAGVVF